MAGVEPRSAKQPRKIVFVREHARSLPAPRLMQRAEGVRAEPAQRGGEAAKAAPASGFVHIIATNRFDAAAECVAGISEVEWK